MLRSHGSRATFSIWNLLLFSYTWPFRVMGVSGSVEKISLNLVFFSWFCLYLNRPCFLPLGHTHLHISCICIVSDFFILIICIIIYIRVSLLEAPLLSFFSILRLRCFFQNVIPVIFFYCSLTGGCGFVPSSSE